MTGKLPRWAATVYSGLWSWSEEKLERRFWLLGSPSANLLLDGSGTPIRGEARSSRKKNQARRARTQEDVTSR
jgi:hypothetical protein